MTIIAILLSISDIITTLFITTHGGVELNPIPLYILMPIKIVAAVGLIVMIILMKKWKIKLTVLFVIFDLWYAIAVIHNIINILVHYI